MANEAKTYAIFRDMLRSKGYYDDKDVVVEEQKSDNAKIDKLLKNASKKGNKNGYPDFILYSKAYPELIIVVEAKADINKHESETRDNYADYAVDGALLYASFLSKEFDVLAIGKEIDDVKKNFKPTVGLLNPPYKTKASDIEEFEFILNNLDALEPGGTCIAIIPISCVIEKTTIAENLRKRVLEKHTLEAVLSMPEELFHNSKVNTVTCAVIMTAHKPHPKGKKTWFAYCRDDGFVKMKNKGRIDANHTWDDIREKWVSAFRNREVIDKFSLMREVSEKDEWCVEAYLETDYDEFTFEDYETTVKKYLMFNFMDMTGMAGGDEENEDL